MIFFFVMPALISARLSSDILSSDGNWNRWLNSVKKRKKGLRKLFCTYNDKVRININIY